MRRAQLSCSIGTLILLLLSAPARAKDSSLSDLGFRARFSGLYGPVSYSSASIASNSTTNIGGNEYGGRVELEKWFNNSLGVMIDGEYISGDLNPGTADSFRGKPLSQNSVAGQLQWKVLGNGDANNSELVLLGGPGVEFFSDMRSYPGQNFYDLVRVNVFGVKVGARARLALGPKVSFEVGGSWFTSAALLGQPSAVLVKGNTRSALGTLALEYHYASGFGVGAGYYYEVNRLNYQINTSLPADAVDFNVSAPFIYLRFGL